MVRVLLDRLLVRSDDGAERVALHAGIVAFGFFGCVGQFVRVMAVDTGDSVMVHPVMDILISLCTVFPGGTIGPELFCLFAQREGGRKFIVDKWLA